MAGKFLSPDGDLEQFFVTDYAMIDQYAKTGSVWLWGNNNYGQLGDNTISSRSSPVQTVAGGTNWSQIVAGGRFAVSKKTDGTLWTWGYNDQYQLGTSGFSKTSSPIQTIVAGTNWKLVSAGQYHGAGIKTDGTLWLWGYNYDGELGEYDTTNRYSAVQTYAGGNNWKQIYCGYSNTYAIKTDGTLWTWGHNTFGTIGDNTTTWRSSPVQTIAGGTNWKQVSGGIYSTSAIKTDGTLWLWGRNASGQLGDGTGTDRSSPVQTIAGGTNWKSVSTNGYFTLATKTDGTLWTWGDNTYGQLGDNTRTGKVSPVQTIAAGTNWKLVSAGQYHAAGIKTDGTLWLWGRNNYGQLGENRAATGYSSPIQTVAGGTNWKSVTLGQNISAGVYFYDAGNLYPNK